MSNNVKTNTIDSNTNLENNIKLNFETTKNINGPIASYRLEGNVGNIKKVLYLFADYHIYESKCKNEISLDINQYIIREFNKINNKEEKITYDFFLETYGFYVGETQKGNTSYLSDLRYTFRRYTNYDSEKNKMTISKFGKKIRLHYIDIRNTLMANGFNMLNIFNTEDIYTIREELYQIFLDAMSFYMLLTQKDIKKISNNSSNLDTMKEKTNLIDLLKNEINMQRKNEYFKSIINKLYNIYENENIKKIIVDSMDIIIENVKIYIEKLKKMYNEIDEFYQNIYAKVYDLNININSDTFYGIPKTEKISKVYKWKLEYLDINNIIVNQMSHLMDYYFIRRFIDKSYITHGITFTGANHTMYTMYILIKKFNFTMTHSTVDKYTMDELNKLIKNTKITNEYDIVPMMVNMLFPDKFNQCSDLSYFPESFL